MDKEVLTRDKLEQIGFFKFDRDSHCEISIPSKFKEIGGEAFAFCEFLRRVKVSGSVHLVETKAFRDCVNLEEVSFEKGLLGLKEFAFSNCYSLNKISLPEGLIAIFQGAFENCVSLESITIPASVEGIKHGAFYGCKKLKEIVILGSTIPFEFDDVIDTPNVLVLVEGKNEEQGTEQKQAEPISITSNKPKDPSKYGFADIAGMDELKAQLQSDVIDVIKEPERAKKLGISLPNGILFYGPPGCGKTYFAQKFAEEAGFNFQLVNCSDIASTYVHGTQEKIAEVFNDARKNAPTILFFDELDAMIAKRSLHNNQSQKGEVNEFLTQLNNCGKDNVIVIGATNRPLDIDEAALRAGRLETKIYIPIPDAPTRAQLFKLKLKGRAFENLDFECLVQKTEGVVAADIQLIVEQAARLAFRRKLECIDMALFEEILRTFKPSVSPATIKKHEEIRNQFLEIEKKYKPIGFC